MYYKDNLAVNVLLKLNIDGYSGIISLSQMKGEVLICLK